MAPVISLVIILTLSVLITKVASEMLIHTGLSKEVARFQARSAFAGVGFTTAEAESIVNHPVRRRITMSLMLIGNVGIISAIASLMLTFVNTSGNTVHNVIRLGTIIGSLGLLILLSRSRWVERRLEKIISKALRRFTSLNIKDYVELMNLQNEYEITVMNIKKEHWMTNRKVGDLQLRQEGINLMGIQRENGDYIGTPYGDTPILENDQLILYGREKTLQNLMERKKDFTSEREHRRAVKEQDQEKDRQQHKNEKVEEAMA